MKRKRKGKKEQHVKRRLTLTGSSWRKMAVPEILRILEASFRSPKRSHTQKAWVEWAVSKVLEKPSWRSFKQVVTKQMRWEIRTQRPSFLRKDQPLLVAVGPLRVRVGLWWVHCEDGEDAEDPEDGEDGEDGPGKSEGENSGAELYASVRWQVFLCVSRFLAPSVLIVCRCCIRSRCTRGAQPH